MQIPRIHFTIRRAMLVVAVIALAFGILRYWQARQYYLQKAADHEGFRAFILMSPDSIRHWEDRWTEQRLGRPAQYPWPAGPPFVPTMAKYHDDMRRKYERAARFPWLPVAPDPL
jgi:hypothetical protein